jgi:hypothetical protein
LFNIYIPIPPIACCLRYTHRRAAANGREGAAASMLKETFCWSCSLTQVHKELSHNNKEKKKKIFASRDLLGTLEAVKLKCTNNMEQPF